jgi:hypothetical protein
MGMQFATPARAVAATSDVSNPPGATGGVSNGGRAELELLPAERGESPDFRGGPNREPPVGGTTRCRTVMLR